MKRLSRVKHDGRRWKGPPSGSPRSRRGRLESVMLYSLWPSLFLLVVVMAARRTTGDILEAEAVGATQEQEEQAWEVLQRETKTAVGQHSARQRQADAAQGARQERQVQLLEQQQVQAEVQARQDMLQGASQQAAQGMALAKELERQHAQSLQQEGTTVQKVITQQRIAALQKSAPAGAQQGPKAAQQGGPQQAMKQEQQPGAQPQQQSMQQQRQGRLVSSTTAYASRDAQGDEMKFHFGFHNVRLTRRELQFFPPTGFKRPEDHWVDFVSGNTTSPFPPTMIAIKGEVQNTYWYYMPVNYSSAPPGTGPVDCKGWVNRTAYLMQVRFSHNIWHTWNEGIMGVFQTFRELGELPLVEVDAAGNVREVIEGRGKGCPLVFDFAANASRPAANCTPKTGGVTTKRCTPAAQPWCRPGVWSYSKQQAPMIVTYTPQALDNPWAHMYSAMTDHISDLSAVEGWCFRHLVIGKAGTMNFYQPYNTTVPLARVAQAERVAASVIFKAFATTAQQRWVQQQDAKQPGTHTFKGYDEAAMEQLRRGIGPESLALADAILPFDPPPRTEAQPAEWLYRRWLQLRDDTRAGLVPPPGQLQPEDAKLQQQLFEAASSAMPVADPSLESPRPVVTYMSRRSPDLRRGILNEHDLLRYILSRYNVTLRVTTLQEPLLEVISLLKHTDVLIGMHGAGWTNGIFLKQGAAAVQLHPYGWQLPDGQFIRGHNYREIVLGNRAKYSEWHNSNRQYAFFRKEDFFKRIRETFDVKFHLHPEPHEVLPTGSWPGNHWIYLATYVDMASLGPVLDEAMRRVGIPSMTPPPAAQAAQRAAQGGAQAQQPVVRQLVNAGASKAQQVPQQGAGQAQQVRATAAAAQVAQQQLVQQPQQQVAQQQPQQRVAQQQPQQRVAQQQPQQRVAQQQPQQRVAQQA